MAPAVASRRPSAQALAPPVMTVPTLHADEVEIDAALVGRLVASQFPLWRDLPLRRIASSGTDNAMFRLGRHLCLRLPRYPAAAALLAKEQHWLPRLAPHLPLAIPVPLATAPQVRAIRLPGRSAAGSPARTPIVAPSATAMGRR